MDTRTHERFHIRDLNQLQSLARDLNLTVPLSEDLSVLARELVVAGRRVPNRFAVQPMEGFDAAPDGSPGVLTHRRYRRYADGGAGLIWMEATSVRPEARSNPGQLWIHEANAPAFARLADAIRSAARAAHGRDIVLVLQLTHSGRYSKPAGFPEPILAHRSPVLDPPLAIPADYPVIGDGDLDRLQDVYVKAARLAARAGFDGVDVKSCHRYLVSELLASFTREGKYGGPFENRSRWLCDTLARIRDDVPSIFVTTRMNAFDAIPYPYGFGVARDDHRAPDLTEPLELARRLARLGAPILNVSIGNPYFNPHFGRPFDFPTTGAPIPDDHPLAGMSRFLAITRRFQETLPDVPIVGSGYSWVRQFIPYVAAGVLHTGGARLVGLGRGAFAYPDWVVDVLRDGRMDPSKCCVTCSACTQIMRDGGRTGCVVRDREVYGPEYRRARRFALDRLREEARRCRNCENATCSAACPAHVDVPAFVNAFADGDVRTAYDILRSCNALPEMCAGVCPSEVQCEGKCLEQIFCENPIPIRDIQWVTCRMARAKGWTGVRIPTEPTAKRVAVVGGGPAGVACAIQLLPMGHAVTLFERGPRLGGVPDSVIPQNRYDRAQSEVDAILEPAVRAGRLSLRFGRELGRNLSLDELRTGFDAVLLAFGLDRSASLGSGPGIVDAIEFLRQIKNGTRTEVPESVAVLGGGNTAMDAAVSALNLGARDVYLVYRRSFAEMPAWPSERDRFLAAGGHCLVLTQPLGYAADGNGQLAGLRVARTRLGTPDESGRRQPTVLPNSESVLPVSLVIEAIGQSVSEEIRAALPGVEFTRPGLIAQPRAGSLATSLDGVFAAGDLVNGGTTAVRAVADGMRAAEEIHRMLSGE